MGSKLQDARMGRGAIEEAGERYLVTTASYRRYSSPVASRSGRPPSASPAAPASGSGRGSGCTAMASASPPPASATVFLSDCNGNGNGRSRTDRWVGGERWALWQCSCKWRRKHFFFRKAEENLDVVLYVGLKVEQDPRGLGGPLPPHVPRQDACTCGTGAQVADEAGVSHEARPTY